MTLHLVERLCGGDRGVGGGGLFRDILEDFVARRVHLEHVPMVLGGLRAGIQEWRSHTTDVEFCIRFQTADLVTVREILQTRLPSRWNDIWTHLGHHRFVDVSFASVDRMELAEL